MKIGLDLRTNFTKNNFLLGEIINVFVEELAKKTENTYNVYLNKNVEIKKEFENVGIFYLDYGVSSIQNQINFRNLLKEHKNDLDIFFGIGRPILYKGNSILFVDNLDNLLYETKEVDNFAKKFKYYFLLEHSCLYSDKIICSNNEAKVALNEKVNIEETKIDVVYPFFLKKNLKNKEEFILQKNDFIIYNSGLGKYNLKIILEMLYNHNKKNSSKLDLIIVGEDYDDLELRKQALSYDLVENIKQLEDNSKYLEWYYKNAICLVNPGYYENFQVELGDALFFNTTILSAFSETQKEIFGDKIFYFKHSSSLDLEKKLEFLRENKKKVDYKEILEKYSLENFMKNFYKELEKFENKS